MLALTFYFMRIMKPHFPGGESKPRRLPLKRLISFLCASPSSTLEQVLSQRLCCGHRSPSPHLSGAQGAAYTPRAALSPAALEAAASALKPGGTKRTLRVFAGERPLLGSFQAPSPLESLFCCDEELVARCHVEVS